LRTIVGEVEDRIMDLLEDREVANDDGFDDDNRLEGILRK